MPANEDYGPLSALKQYLDYRPLGNDPWTNTMRGTAPAPGQGFSSAADPVLYPTASPLVNITEGDIKRATNVGLAASGGGLKGQQIKAYHSSPHDFVPEPGYPLGRFDLSKALTGEGAQMHGPGAYLAENPAVSGQGGQYWNQFKSRFEGPEGMAAKVLEAGKFDRQAAIDLLDKSIKRQAGIGSPPEAGWMQNAAQARKLLESGQPVGPRTYEVNINADPAHMMNLDTTLGAQNPAVQDYFRKQLSQFGPEAGMERQYKIAGSRGGGLGRVTEGLQEAGVPGIKYLDQGSRGPQIQTINGVRSFVPRSNTSNYVVFNPSIIDIIKKYGLAGLAAPPAIAGAMNQERQP